MIQKRPILGWKVTLTTVCLPWSGDILDRCSCLPLHSTSETRQVYCMIHHNCAREDTHYLYLSKYEWATKMAWLSSWFTCWLYTCHVHWDMPMATPVGWFVVLVVSHNNMDTHTHTHTFIYSYRDQMELPLYTRASMPLCRRKLSFIYCNCVRNLNEKHSFKFWQRQK